jgi:RNA polymerase sigma factor (sigma-70 family)
MALAWRASRPAPPTPQSDRDDLLQNIAMAVWRALPSFRGESSARTFLYRIAHNRAVAFLARNRTNIPAVEVDTPDPAPGPESRLLRAQSSERLRSAVRRLPVIYRQVITLILEGMNYAEIGEVLGISESNVGARLSRARQLLRELLEKPQ